MSFCKPLLDENVETVEKKGSRKFKTFVLDYHKGLGFVVLFINFSGIFAFWLSEEVIRGRCVIWSI